VSRQDTPGPRILLRGDKTNQPSTPRFTPFHRTGASRETIPGVGLGLWVSRRIVEAHGGALEVSSELGVGSTFRVRLPLATPAGVAAAAQHAIGLH